MKTSISSIALAVIGVASLAFAIPMSVARAQSAGTTESPKELPAQDSRPGAPSQAFGSGQAQPGLPPQPGFAAPAQSFPGQPMPQMRGGGMGGGATMVADGDSLYILMGARLFKVAKNDLRVVKVGGLPMDMQMQPQPFEGNPGAPGAAGPRRGAGGGAAPGAGGRGGGALGGGNKAK